MLALSVPGERCTVSSIQEPKNRRERRARDGPALGAGARDAFARLLDLWVFRHRFVLGGGHSPGGVWAVRGPTLVSWGVRTKTADSGLGVTSGSKGRGGRRRRLSWSDQTVGRAAGGAQPAKRGCPDPRAGYLSSTLVARPPGDARLWVARTRRPALGIWCRTRSGPCAVTVQV